MRNIYQVVLYALDGSNIRGIVNALLEVMDELRDNGLDSDALRKHPVVKLYAAKLIEMTEMGLADSEAFGDAYHICKERAASLNEQETSTSN